jgi:hypothetical protein
MSLPTLVKTWQFLVNQTTTATGTSDGDCRAVMWNLKNSLVMTTGGFSTPWTVVASSDGAGNIAPVSGSPTVTDLWTGPTKITEGSTNHSWIVLKQAAISSNYQICIDFNNSSTLRYMTLLWSPSVGFTGGTAGARPTASDSITLISNNQWLGGFTTSQQYQLHVMMSSDGQCTRIAGYSQSALQMLWMFDRPNNAVSGWTTPAVAMALQFAGWASYSELWSTANVYGHVSGPMTMFMTTEAYNGAPLGQKWSGAPNDLDGNSPLTPIGLASETALMRGRHGTLYDMWFGNYTYLEGDTYPNSSANQFVTFTNTVHPWNGSTVLVT